MITAFDIKKVCIEVRKGKFECRSIPHSPNRIFGMHWSRRKKWADAWQDEVVQQARLAKLTAYKLDKSIKFPAEHAVVQVYLFTISPQDDDNAMASLKPLIDGLRYGRLIWDDNSKACEIKNPIVIHVPRKDMERTRIEVTDLDQ